MIKERKPRAIGETIILGATEYCIEGIEGCGGSAIVYRASYRDGLNHDGIHKILIKELFPWHPKGLIARDETGRIVCKPGAEAWMQRCRQSFYMGNQANLDLLARMPGQISGNLNSFEAHGTYYSVLPVHGGKNLQKLLEEGKGPGTLREIAVLIDKLLDALECFHNSKVLHLDISPDNILLLPTHVLLIDYNSVWPMHRNPEDVYYFSEKRGYCAPEVKLREEAQIGAAADLYSVSAVFFRLLTGNCLTEEVLSGQGVNKCFPRNLKVFQGEYESAAYKTVQIVSRGLHVLERKRYQSAAEMKKGLAELFCRIDKKGVSRQTIFEGSRREFRRQARYFDGSYLSRHIEMEAGTVLTEDGCYQALCNGSGMLLTGAGGMGKTQLLWRIWEKGVENYRDSLPVVLYIPLVHYQETKGEPRYIFTRMLRHCRISEEAGGMEEAAEALCCLLEDAAPGSILLLLDGLNEAGSQKRYLIREIERLKEYKSIGLLVTDRTDAVKKYGLYGVQTARLLPLTEEAVSAELAGTGISLPAQEGVAQLLSNPMFLVLYKKTWGLVQDNGREPDKTGNPEQMDGMIGFYLENLHIQDMRKNSGNEPEQLRRSYVLQNLLPDIAEKMRRKKKNLLRLEELYALVCQNYRMLQDQNFAMAFPEYMGKTRLMLQGIRDKREWFDYAVAEQLIAHWNLVERDSEGGYRLIHDNFIGYLAGQSQKKQKRLSRYRLKGWMKTWGIRAGVTLLAAAAITAALWIWKAPAGRLSQKEQGIVYSAMQRMEMNMGICNDQLRCQLRILEQASRQGVLEGNAREQQKLKERIETALAETDSRYVSYRDGQEHVEKLERMGSILPLGLAEELYHKPQELREITEHAVLLLQERLCNADSIYNTYDRRKQLVDAYQNFVTAYSRMCGVQYSQLIYSLQDIQAEQAAAEMRDAAAEYLVLGEYISFYDSQEQLSVAMKKAERKLSEARKAMRQQNLY